MSLIRKQQVAETAATHGFIAVPRCSDCNFPRYPLTVGHTHVDVGSAEANATHTHTRTRALGYLAAANAKNRTGPEEESVILGDPSDDSVLKFRFTRKGPSA